MLSFYFTFQILPFYFRLFILPLYFAILFCHCIPPCYFAHLSFPFYFISPSFFALLFFISPFFFALYFISPFFFTLYSISPFFSPFCFVFFIYIFKCKLVSAFLYQVLIQIYFFAHADEYTTQQHYILLATRNDSRLTKPEIQHCIHFTTTHNDSQRLTATHSDSQRLTTTHNDSPVTR